MTNRNIAMIYHEKYGCGDKSPPECADSHRGRCNLKLRIIQIRGLRVCLKKGSNSLNLLVKLALFPIQLAIWAPKTPTPFWNPFFSGIYNWYKHV